MAFCGVIMDLVLLSTKKRKERVKNFATVNGISMVRCAMNDAVEVNNNTNQSKTLQTLESILFFHCQFIECHQNPSYPLLTSSHHPSTPLTAL